MSYRPSSPPIRRGGGSRRPPSRGSDDFELDCKAAFLAVIDDLDQDIMSERELREVLQQSGRNPTAKTMKKYWTRNTDSVSFDEFMRICEKEPQTSEDELMKAFKRIDTNGDGYISHSELMRVMTTRGERMTADEVRDMIAEVDENNDGRLDYDEFSKMVMSTANEARDLARKQLEKRDRKKGNMNGSSSRKGSRSLRSHEPEHSDKDSEEDNNGPLSSRSHKSSARNSLRVESPRSSRSHHSRFGGDGGEDPESEPLSKAELPSEEAKNEGNRDKEQDARDSADKDSGTEDTMEADTVKSSRRESMVSVAYKSSRRGSTASIRSHASARKLPPDVEEVKEKGRERDSSGSPARRDSLTKRTKEPDVASIRSSRRGSVTSIAKSSRRGSNASVRSHASARKLPSDGT